MKISEMLKAVDEGWVQKPKGFRVRFQMLQDGKWVTDTMPGPKGKPLDSDVVAWRSAWKLFHASRPGGTEYVNLTVVDDQDNPIPYYATGKLEVFNPRQNAADAPLAASSAGQSIESDEKIPNALPADDELDGNAQPDSEVSQR
jgi:hypothetical protein